MEIESFCHAWLAGRTNPPSCLFSKLQGETMLVNCHLSNRRRLHAIAALLVIIGGSVASWTESHTSPLGNCTARAASNTIFARGTRGPRFVTIPITVTFP